MSIATAITQLQARIQAAYAAAQEKGATIPTVCNTANLPNAITSIPTSGGASGNDVVFKDCDGTILHSYSASEVASMTELPALPTQPGLSCQGWNWTLQQLKEKHSQMLSKQQTIRH